ncbi:hypothetical protein GCM10027088_11610 [Nocardia goodfellowii]
MSAMATLDMADPLHPDAPAPGIVFGRYSSSTGVLLLERDLYGVLTLPERNLTAPFQQSTAGRKRTVNARVHDAKEP